MQAFTKGEGRETKPKRPPKFWFNLELNSNQGSEQIKEDKTG